MVEEITPETAGSICFIKLCETNSNLLFQYRERIIQQFLIHWSERRRTSIPEELLPIKRLGNLSYFAFHQSLVLIFWNTNYKYNLE